MEYPRSAAAYDPWAVQDLLALGFRDATPDAIRLAHDQCVVGTFAPHRTTAAEVLRGVLALAPGRFSLTVRVEEQVVLAAALREQLPFPTPGLSSRRPRGSHDVRHGASIYDSV